MNKVYEFVITGGPCAGKTTGLSKLDRVFTDRGYKVIIVAETATEVILSGINPNEVSTLEFQRVIIDRGINKEKTTRRVAKFFGRDVIIFYDRGLLDSKAYMEEKDFVRILKRNKLTEIEARDSYDAIFHLVTAAIGAEQYYTKQNNKARRETLQQARLADRKTLDAWTGHPHLRVIDNSTGFNGKMDRLIKEAFAAMGIPTPVETERKFLVKLPSEQQLKDCKSVKSNIVQTYLKRLDEDVERRVRQRGIGGEFSYYYTEKKKLSTCSRDEVERRISKSEYLALLVEGVATVRKDRYCFFYDNQYFELDVYPDWENEAILEIELTEEMQEVELPDWISVIKEVTGNDSYSNAALAK